MTDVREGTSQAQGAGGPSPDLTIVSRHVYRGPNVWSYRPAIRLLVDLGSLEDFPTDRLPGFTERLVALLPGLEEHTCSVGRRGGFIQRMVDGTWAGHVAEHVALQLQAETGAEVSRGKTRSADRRGPLPRDLRVVARARRPGRRRPRGADRQPPTSGRKRASIRRSRSRR